MKYQEKFIAAFLYVWENQPKLFDNSEAIDGLTQLQDQLINASTASVGEISGILDKWCEDYDEITNAVSLAINRKLRLGDSAPTPEDSKTLDNRYPEISKVLRDRLPKDGEEEVKSGET